MIHTHRPRRPLSRFVESIWLHDGPLVAHRRERVLPTGSMELIFDLCSGAGAGSLVNGARSTSFVIETGRATSVMGVDFAPGGAFPLLGAPAGEFQDALVPLEAVWGRKAAEIRERLADAPTAGRKFAILESALIDRAACAPEPHPAASVALEAFLGSAETPSVGSVARRVGLSPRRFIQVFRDRVGLSPKLFCRVRRFQRVLPATEGRPRVDWAAVALSCGYADQAHLVRDFRAFSGLNPTAYLAARGQNPIHVPLAD
jgi:AraC-like DNA-binding protein